VLYAAGSANAYFNWQSQAIADGKNVVVYQQVISGQSITNFDLKTITPFSVEYFLILYYKYVVGVWNAFNYNTQFLFFSWVFINKILGSDLLILWGKYFASV